MIYGLSHIFVPTAQRVFLPKLEDVFPLLIVVSHLTHSLSEADGHLSVVWNAVACAFSVFIKAKTSFS